MSTLALLISLPYDISYTLAASINPPGALSRPWATSFFKISAVSLHYPSLM